MTFHDTRLPVDVERGALGGPGFKTTVTPLGSGLEQRNIDWSKVRGKWDIGYGIMDEESVILEATLNALQHFFYTREGRAHSFRFKDWSDFKIGDYLNPTTDNQSIGIGDTVEVAFPVFKRYSDGGVTYDRPLTKLVVGRVIVLFDNVVQVACFTIDYITGIITFSGPPAGGVNVQVALEFDTHVRFDTDHMQLDILRHTVGSWPNIPIIELKT